LIHYKADPAKDKGAAIIICPGGGFHALSIESEGEMLASWLAERGISSFILKYRLVPTGDDGVQEYQEKSMKGEGRELTGQLIKLSIADGVSAVDYVRKNAASLGVKTDMIGVIGFSAGGTVAAGTAFLATATTMPTFIAPIYGYLSPFDEMPFPENAPPLFVSAASDDPLQLAPHSAQIYSRWIENRKPAEIHMYAKGGHGYGMRKNNNVSDTWVERFGDWLGSMGWL
jgi:acetyl esterase/lipase